jgi:hypothetical protein
MWGIHFWTGESENVVQNDIKLCILSLFRPCEALAKSHLVIRVIFIEQKNKNLIVRRPAAPNIQK